MFSTILLYFKVLLFLEHFLTFPHEWCMGIIFTLSYMILLWHNFFCTSLTLMSFVLSLCTSSCSICVLIIARTMIPRLFSPYPSPEYLYVLFSVIFHISRRTRMCRHFWSLNLIIWLLRFHTHPCSLEIYSYLDQAESNISLGL